MMELELRQRAKKFIGKSVEALDKASSFLNEDLANFQNTSKDYLEASKAYIEARQQYIEYLEKYQDTDKQGPALANFPGIVSNLPSYTPTEMRADTQKMQELTAFIKEQASRIDILEDQMKRALSRMVSSANTAVTSSTHASAYLDQVITGMDSVYDVGMLG